MGWAGGSVLLSQVWKEVGGYIPYTKKKKVALHLIELFEAMDCDTVCECSFLEEEGISWDEDKGEWN